MAKDQLRQHQPADGPAASAEALHAVPADGDSTPAPKRALAQSSYPSAESQSLLQPPDPTFILPSSATHIEGPQLNLYPTEPHLARRNASRDRVADQEAALRRLNGLDIEPKSGAASGSVASTQPVLVRQYSKGSQAASNPNQSTKMKQNRHSRGSQDTSGMPSLQSFSFQDILASVDPEVSGSIDKIAEICGRSKMSLADEYSSHLPPQGHLPVPLLQDHVEGVPIPRLEPVEEVSSTHEGSVQGAHTTYSRATRLSIAGESMRTMEDLLSTAVTATSGAASHVHSSPAPGNTRRSGPQSSYLPQLLAWLRISRDGSAQTSRRDSMAANALQRALSSGTDSAMP
ncbi:MAG: hypothetical protein Q9218_006626 [Villophora microphyllina]